MSEQKTAVLFPGQGAQAVGMGRELYENFAGAREAFETASKALSFSLEKLCFEGPEEQLTLTENTQPAILTVSIAAWRALAEKTDLASLNIVAFAGHSLGEYSALVAAGAMELADAVRVVRARGKAMQEAVPSGAGKMAAVMGLESGALQDLCDKAAAQTGEIVSPANFNAPGQIVIAGTAKAVDAACTLVSEAGKKAVPLNVSAPFHCALMAPAAEALEPVLAGVNVNAPSAPVFRNVDAESHEGPESIRSMLVKQVTSPVRWTDTVAALQAQGAGRFIEVGPGRVLAGLVKRIDRKVPVANVGDLESLAKLAEQLAA